MTDHSQELLAALKAEACDSDLRSCRMNWPDHPASWCAGCLMHAAAEAIAASADASAPRAVSPDQQAVKDEAERLLKDWDANTEAEWSESHCRHAFNEDGYTADSAALWSAAPRLVRSLLAALSQEPR